MEMSDEWQRRRETKEREDRWDEEGEWKEDRLLSTTRNTRRALECGGDGENRPALA